MEKAPLAHESACSTVKLLPHNTFRRQLRWRQAISQGQRVMKAGEKPCSVMGSMVSQVEAHFSLAIGQRPSVVSQVDGCGDPLLP